MADTSSVLEQVVAPVTEDGDHERFTHIVLEGFHVDDDTFVATGELGRRGHGERHAGGRALREGLGPGRDPTRYPVCPTCKDIARSMGWSVPG